MNFAAILYEVEDGILTITLNRPEMLNAFNGAMSREFMQAFDLSDADDDIGAGQRAVAGYRFGEPEVGDLGVATLGQQDV